jgi:hypothetical protein
MDVRRPEFFSPQRLRAWPVGGCYADWRQFFALNNTCEISLTLEQVVGRITVGASASFGSLRRARISASWFHARHS